MTELSVDLNNCYGIKELHHVFKFKPNKQIQLIYAPNGSLKTSFAKTMRYLSGQSKDKPCDILQPKEVTSYTFKSDDTTIPTENIFVVDGEENIDSTKSFINFLASSELKNRYDEIYKQLSGTKDALMSKLKSVSQSTDCEKELFNTFKQSDTDTIFIILDSLKKEVSASWYKYEFKYNDIFDNEFKKLVLMILINLLLNV